MAEETNASCSSSSSSSSSAAPPQPPALPKEPPKIPLPPSEHPPPYTPFSTQSASLLPGTSSQQGQAQNRRRVVQPPGFHKYLQYLTARNLLIGLAALAAILLLAYLVHLANSADEELARGGRPLDGSSRALGVEHRGLGRIKGRRDRLSFDESADAVILSEFDSELQKLRVETVKLGDHLAGLEPSQLDLAESELGPAGINLEFEDCIRFTGQLFCCSTGTQSRQHLTKCFLRQQGQNITSVASMFDFVPHWQSLADDEMLLLVHNQQRDSVLDLRRNILHPVDKSGVPRGYVSHGFHFSQDTAEELAELVREDGQFRICEYVRTRQVDQEHGIYAPKERECRRTPFKADLERPKVLFCVNSLYTALIQFGHLPGEEATLSWHLRVKFDSSEEVFSAAETVHSRQEQMAVDCDDRRVELFAIGDHELHQFTVRLPNKEGNENKRRRRDQPLA